MISKSNKLKVNPPCKPYNELQIKLYEREGNEICITSLIVHLICLEVN